MKNKNKMSISEALYDLTGKLEGGFTVINAQENSMILGGDAEEANNCLGGNCVKGCGTNDARGCGGTINTVPGCGVTPPTSN